MLQIKHISKQYKTGDLIQNALKKEEKAADLKAKAEENVKALAAWVPKTKPANITKVVNIFFIIIIFLQIIFSKQLVAFCRKEFFYVRQNCFDSCNNRCT